MNDSMLRDWTNEDHHADRSAVSHSMLEVFRRSSVEYAARYVHRTMEPPEPTPQMVLGSALHCLLLEPEQFESRYTIGPDVDKRTKEWKAFIAELQEGITPITGDQNAAINAMVKSVVHHPEAAAILRDTLWRERSLVSCVEGGFDLKARIDVMCRRPIIADVKSAADVSPEGWARQATNLGYHRQAAFYRELAKEYRGEQVQFVFIVVENCEPWECACYTLDAAAMDLGHMQNIATLDRLKTSIETDDYWGDQNKLIMTLELPKYAYTQE